MNNKQDTQSEPDFSLVLGGPTFQLLVRAHLATPALELVKKRMIVISLFCWLPLLLLALLEGNAWGGKMPFLYDLDMHARFLVALPLLIFAELFIHQRTRGLLEQFFQRGIVSEAVRPKFRAVIDAGMKLRNSITIEIILFLFAFVVGYYSWHTLSVVDKAGGGGESWYNVMRAGELELSLAGGWYVFVVRPLFQFLLMRWYFRWFIWTRMLWQISRLDLNLIPTHPDRACGLGFLGVASVAFAPFILAHGALMAGVVANHIFLSGAILTDFKMEILGVVVLLLLVVLGPLLAFSLPLMKAKRVGLREYGTLSSRYVADFERKWLRGGAGDEILVGSADIQSLADMGNAFQVIREIKPVPFSRGTVLQIAFYVLLPGLPLVLTIIPFEELIMKLVAMVL